MHRRITLLMLVLISMSNIAFAIVIYIANEELEMSMLNSHLEHEMDHLIQRRTEGAAALLPRSATLQAYLRSRAQQLPIPSRFAEVGPGYHHDIKLKGRYYHLAVRDIDDDRAYIALDITALEQKEVKLESFIFSGALLSPLAVIWIGYWLVQKVIAPVSRLANQLARLDPRQRNVRLADNYRGYEVELIAHAFDRYMERMDGFVEREQLFTAAASHELRSPLAVISTSAEILAGNTQLSARLRPQVTRIARATHDMSELITGLLFLSREPQSDEHTENAKTNLGALMNRLVDYQRPILESRSLDCHLNTKTPATILAPESHIGIVLSNLLRNAIGNTHSGTIDIEVHHHRVKISDTGIGVAPFDLDHIFERHYRGRQSKGAGLGLHLVKNICSRYGWQLRLHSTPGRGTTAVVDFS